MDELDLIESSF